MADSIGPLEDQIRRDRRALRETVRELEDRVLAATDWRTHYRAHTGAALTAAFAGGLLIGASARNGRREERVGVLTALDPSGRVRVHARDICDQIILALVGVAATALVNVVSDFVPGFKNEFESQRSDRSGVRHESY
jgi:hypothetical protein